MASDMVVDTGDVGAAITDAGIIAMIRGDFSVAQTVAIGRTLVDESVCVLEVALNSTHALDGIAALRAELGERALVGAGTVRTPDDLDLAIDAGAQFAVSPMFDTDTVERSHERGMFYLPGVLTPTEALAAHAAGCRMLKLFPSDVFGPRYLGAMRAPLDDLRFVPTGGVNAENIGAYSAQGAAAVGVGSALVAGPDQPLDDLAQRARALYAAWQGAR